MFDKRVKRAKHVRQRPVMSMKSPSAPPPHPLIVELHFFVVGDQVTTRCQYERFEANSIAALKVLFYSCLNELLHHAFVSPSGDTYAQRMHVL